MAVRTASVGALLTYYSASASLKVVHQLKAFSNEIAPDHLFLIFYKVGYILCQLTWYNPKQVGFDHCVTRGTEW
jgi:hypothetical protein